MTYNLLHLCRKFSPFKVTQVGTVALRKTEGQLCIYQQGKPFWLMIILLYIILKVIVCFLDQYSMIKYAFLFIISNTDH